MSKWISQSPNLFVTLSNEVYNSIVTIHIRKWIQRFICKCPNSQVPMKLGVSNKGTWSTETLYFSSSFAVRQWTLLWLPGKILGVSTLLFLINKQFYLTLLSHKRNHHYALCGSLFACGVFDTHTGSFLLSTMFAMALKTKNPFFLIFFLPLFTFKNNRTAIDFSACSDWN